MKTNITTILIAAGLFISIRTNATGTVTLPLYVINTVEGTAFNYFRAHKMADDIMLNWGVSNPLAVHHFAIEYSYDNDYFYQIAEVAGTGMAAYSYRDRNVFPGYSWYRIVAHHYDGTTTVSEVEEVRIIKKK